IAGQHAHGVAPLRVGGGTAAADLGLVNEVIVDERRRVDDLNDGRELYRALALVAEELGREQQQRWTDSLAPAGAQVLADLRNRGNVRDRIAPELFFDRDNVVTQKIEDFFPVNGRRRGHKCSVAPVIRELQIDAKILLLDHRDQLLQRVAILAADPHYVALDRGWRFFLRILDQLHDFSGLFNRDPLLNGDLLLHCASGGWFQRAIGQAFQGHAAFYQLLLKNVIYRLHFEFIGGVKQDRVGALHRNLGLRVLEIEARADLLHRLLDGVGNLRQVDFTDDIETVIGHGISPSKSRSKYITALKSLDCRAVRGARSKAQSPTDRSPQTCTPEGNRRGIICEGWTPGVRPAHFINCHPERSEGSASRASRRSLTSFGMTKSS